MIHLLATIFKFNQIKIAPSVYVRNVIRQ